MIVCREEPSVGFVFSDTYSENSGVCSDFVFTPAVCRVRSGSERARFD
jgi:hypothetical protein